MTGVGVSLDLNEDYTEIREAVTKICDEYPGEYWRGLEDQGPEGSYPTDFVKELTDAGFLGAVGPIWLAPCLRARSAPEYGLLEPRRTSGGGGQHPSDG